MGQLENHLSDFDEIMAIGFVMADSVLITNWHFFASAGFWDMRGGFGGQN